MARPARKRVCHWCGKGFFGKSWQKSCEECREKHRLTKTCTACGKTFETWLTNQYRCRECCDANKRVMLTCRLCGEQFLANSRHKKHCDKCSGRSMGQQYRQEVPYTYRGATRTIRLSIPELSACQLYVNGWEIREIVQKTGLARRHLLRLFDDKVIPGVKEYMTATAENEINKLTVEVQRIITMVIKEMEKKFLTDKKTKKDLHDWVRLTMDWLGQIKTTGGQQAKANLTDEEILRLAKEARWGSDAGDNETGDGWEIGESGNSGENITEEKIEEKMTENIKDGEYGGDTDATPDAGGAREKTTD